MTSGAEPIVATVVDASVAVRWLVHEPGAEAAQALLAEDRLWLAPRLAVTEVASALMRKTKDGVLAAPRAEASLLALLQFVDTGELALAQDEKLAALAFSIANSSGHRLADCV